MCKDDSLTAQHPKHYCSGSTGEMALEAKPVIDTLIDCRVMVSPGKCETFDITRQSFTKRAVSNSHDIPLENVLNAPLYILYIMHIERSSENKI